MIFAPRFTETYIFPVIMNFTGPDANTVCACKPLKNKIMCSVFIKVSLEEKKT